MTKAPALLPFCLALTLSSCASLAPAALPPASLAAGVLPDASPTAPGPEWRPVASGIAHAFLRASDPRIEAHALRIDLSADGLEPVVTRASAGATRSQRVSGFAREQGCAVAVNAAPFDVSTATEGLPLRISGLTVFEGLALSPPLAGKALLVLRHDASGGFRAELSAQPQREGEFDCRGVAAAVGGFFVVLADGEVEGGARSREPRTAAGISADGRVLYLLVADGRSVESAGLTDREAGLWLAWLGARSGMTLDGGGSSAMAVRGPAGKIAIVNFPVHGGVRGRERAVGSCLGFRAAPLP